MRAKESIAEIAEAVRAALEPSGRGEHDARRSAFYFVPQFDSATPKERLQMVEQSPPPTGDARYDALLAALVEHLCARWDMPTPVWADEPERFVEPWWFVSGLRSLHATALVQSPISFARRGVFICDGALSYA
jgi:hypothetical protein